MQKINEKKFYDALEDIFTGTKIEGEGGYINLLAIKSAYYQKVLKQFKEEVDKDEVITDSFREEFFDKLYNFFEKYFSESGSVYFVKTANYQRVYEKVYTDTRDVILFWKTHMLYYVKSDILFKSMNVEIDGYNFFFDVSKLETKQNNEKRELIFEFEEVKREENEDGVKKTVVLSVTYSERGRKTKKDKILKALREEGITLSEDILDKAIKTFKKQSEVDFFINKNAKKFLEEQLDLYLHQLLLTEENKFEQKRLNQIKTIQKFAKKIISFISQFEDELVKVWNKPKFVLNSNYVITIDKLSDEILQRIATHENLNRQVKEWAELGMVEENFDFNKREEKHKFLPIDTKYFKDLEIEILNLFDNLDEALDGRLIHSENYQALNTLQNKYREEVQCIYIDPPFNLEKNPDFDYKVNYKDSNWATMLENRLRLAYKFLKDEGSIFVRCDYNGNYIVRMLLDEIFWKGNFRNEIVISRTKKIFTGVQGYNVANDSLFFYTKGNNFIFRPVYKKREKKQKWLNMHSPGERKPPERIILGRLLYPPKGRHWTFVQEKIYELEKQRRIRINEDIEYIDMLGNKVKGMPQYLTGEEELLDSNWMDVPDYSQAHGFPTENSEILLKRVIESTSNEGDLIMDFFLGSATTQAVAQKLKRKWIGVEMGEQFFDVELPRLKKVIFGKQGGISQELEEKYKGSGFFKYYDLEQYEDTLKRMKYKDYEGDLFTKSKRIFEEYIFFGDEKLALSEVIKEREDEIIELDFEKLYPNIDWAETISNLLGLPIKKITKTSVILQDGNSEKEIRFDYKNMNNEEKIEFLQLIKPLIWWGE